MLDTLIQHDSVREIMSDTGLAQIGDSLANLCYSVAKSSVLGQFVGERVRDDVLAKAIRSNPVYGEMGKRTDVGQAGDAYEAILAYVWLTGGTSIESVVSTLKQNLLIDSKTGRKQENNIASGAFRVLLDDLIAALPLYKRENQDSDHEHVGQ